MSKQTFEERCLLAEQCLPDAPYRAMLKKLHTEMLAKLAEQPAQQEPVAWKLVPREPTHEMLKAMDECSTEGYDERLYAGHASSVYMAAVDAAPTPPAQQEPWVGLTENELEDIWERHHTSLGGWDYGGDDVMYYRHFEPAVADIEAKLKEKNA